MMESVVCGVDVGLGAAGCMLLHLQGGGACMHRRGHHEGWCRRSCGPRDGGGRGDAGTPCSMHAQGECMARSHRCGRSRSLLRARVPSVQGGSARQNNLCCTFVAMREIASCGLWRRRRKNESAPSSNESAPSSNESAP